jgi:transcriptional regulator with XRE-family HTH domain
MQKQPRDVLNFMYDMMERDPELKAEYERLGPRYEAISALIGARKRAKVSQGELAERMGVSQAVVSRLESAEHSPRLDTLAEAARAMGYRVEVRFVREQSGRYSAPRERTAARTPRTRKRATQGDSGVVD